jgi:small GTP-binding protein
MVVDEINEEKGFFDRVSAIFSKEAPDLSQTLNIAVIGKVSAGKSSLINALLRMSRRQALEVAKVGAISGVTKDLTILKLDEKVCLVDSPGLDDVRAENSEVTKQFLSHIDIGIFVVTGSSDASQKRNLDQLKQCCDQVFVVLNKADEWDDLAPSVLEDVTEQWKSHLEVSQIYLTCTKGYDPKSLSSKMDIRGVSRLRYDVEKFLEKKGKDLLLARHMAEKRSYAVKIIAAALIAVSGSAFLPGSAAWIAGAQSVAIASLYYLYKGEILSSETAIAVLPTFLAETAGSSLFLFVKSFLPPTGIIDVAAAGVAATITLAMLAAVNHLLSSGVELEQKELLQSRFKMYRKQTPGAMKDMGNTGFTDLAGMSTIVTSFLGGRYGVG